MRLTKKQRFTPFSNYELNFELDNGKLSPTGTQQDVINKLGQLEDIEEELGIDLITLFKALKNGIYAKVYIPMSFGAKEIKFLNVEKTGLGLYKNFIRTNYGLYQLKDYGETWALTREELKK